MKNMFFRFTSLFLFIFFSIHNTFSIKDYTRLNNKKIINFIKTNHMNAIRKDIGFDVKLDENGYVILLLDSKNTNLIKVVYYIYGYNNKKLVEGFGFSKFIFDKKFDIEEILEFLKSEQPSYKINFELSNFGYKLYDSLPSFVSDLFTTKEMLERDLRFFGEVSDYDKIIYTQKDTPDESLQTWFVIQKGNGNKKLFEKKFKFSDQVNFENFTFLHEIKEENKKENILSKIQNYCSEKINNLRCYFLQKNNLNSINNEETKRLLSNKVKFN